MGYSFLSIIFSEANTNKIITSFFINLQRVYRIKRPAPLSFWVLGHFPLLKYTEDTKAFCLCELQLMVLIALEIKTSIHFKSLKLRSCYMLTKAYAYEKK